MDLKLEYKRPVELTVDNKSSISLSNNLMFHGKSNHISTKFHFLIDLVNQKRIELVQRSNEVRIADVFTKPSGKTKVRETYKNVECKVFQ